MAAQHLAAIKIQNIVRKFLYKKHKVERKALAAKIGPKKYLLMQ
jgi:hypothetical protein